MVGRHGWANVAVDREAVDYDAGSVVYGMVTTTLAASCTGMVEG